MNIPPQVIGIIIAICAGTVYALIGYLRCPDPFNNKRFLLTLIITSLTGLGLVLILPLTNWTEYIALFLAVIGMDAVRTTGTPKAS